MHDENVELSWVVDFLMLAQTGNFSRAAEHRNVAQPAFSRHIRSLEEWLGVTLVDRTAHPTSLTEAGRHFLPMARDILNRLAVAKEETRYVDKNAAATLRFASTHALSLTFFPRWLHGLESTVRNAPIHLVSDSLQGCETLMLNGAVHFLLCHYHRQVANRLETTDFRSARVGADTLVPVVGKRGPMLPAFGQDRRSGDHFPVLAYSEESGLGRIVRALLGTALEKALADIIFTAHLAAVLKTMALDGRGVAWLPASMIVEEMGDGRLIAAGGAKWNIPVEIRIYRRNLVEAIAAENFWSKIMEKAPKGKQHER
jgi:LysR family transcriptional regulator, hypochlorite-specific transcription factor HypT